MSNMLDFFYYYARNIIFIPFTGINPLQPHYVSVHCIVNLMTVMEDRSHRVEVICVQIHLM